MEIVDFNKDKIIKEKFLPYIKPTRRKHDSGFRIFEVGYCKLDGKNRVSEKMVMGECSDSIWFRDLPTNKLFSLNIDLTYDGYIRIWPDYLHRMFWGKFGDIVVYTADARFDKV